MHHGYLYNSTLYRAPWYALSDVSSTRNKNRQSCSCVVGTNDEVELRLIGVLVVVNTVVCDDISYWTAVDGEQQRHEHRAQRNADLEFRDG